jgi:MinD-like ATPase involved in chromosome partitioning or flagellar assembly
MTMLPAGPLRPSRRADVRPVEQQGDFSLDGFEGDVLPVAAVSAASRSRGWPRREPLEASLDEQLAAAPAVSGIVSLMSCAGGVGKSTVSLTLADIFARAGRGPVALVDCDPEFAGLSLLAPGGGEMSRLISHPEIPLQPHATILPARVDLYATGHHAPVLELIMNRPEILRQIAQILRDQYPLVILDAGAGLQNPVGRTLAEICDLAVLVSRATIATTAAMIYSYRHLRRGRGLVDHEREPAPTTSVVAVINNVAEHQLTDLQIVKDESTSAGLAPVLVPHNPSIETALEQGELNLGELGASSRLALKQFALTTLNAIPR